MPELAGGAGALLGDEAGPGEAEQVGAAEVGRAERLDREPYVGVGRRPLDGRGAGLVGVDPPAALVPRRRRSATSRRRRTARSRCGPSAPRAGRRAGSRGCRRSRCRRWSVGRRPRAGAGRRRRPCASLTVRPGRSRPAGAAGRGGWRARRRPPTPRACRPGRACSHFVVAAEHREPDVRAVAPGEEHPPRLLVAQVARAAAGRPARSTQARRRRRPARRSRGGTSRIRAGTSGSVTVAIRVVTARGRLVQSRRGQGRAAGQA